MNCEGARDSIILAAYGELPDDEAVGLEQHLAACEECLSQLNQMRELDQAMAFHPVGELDPNFMAQSRMLLDEALDQIPQHGFLTRLRANAGIWFGHIQSAPALATLLVGVGFLGGNLTYQYQAAHAPKPAPFVVLSGPGGGVSTISSITQLPGGLVKVSYNRVLPEVAEGSLGDPQIQRLLVYGTKAADSNSVRLDSIAMLADGCKAGQECKAETDGTGVRATLLTSLRSDRDPRVRMRALEGLQPYVAQDERVRDAVAQALLMDSNSSVRAKAIAVLEPVNADTSVRQVLRTVSMTDENPYIRTVSTNSLSSSSMQ